MGGDFSVSPWSKYFFFSFWGTFIQLGGLLGQGLRLGLGPGLDKNMELKLSRSESKSSQSKFEGLGQCHVKELKVRSTDGIQLFTLNSL